jgi:hypothetical protein
LAARLYTLITIPGKPTHRTEAIPLGKAAAGRGT